MRRNVGEREKSGRKGDRKVRVETEKVRGRERVEKRKGKLTIEKRKKERR